MYFFVTCIYIDIIADVNELTNIFIILLWGIVFTKIFLMYIFSVSLASIRSVKKNTFE